MTEEATRLMKEGFFRSLLEPINPHLCVLAGMLNIAFGAWSLIPVHNEFYPDQLVGGVAPSLVLIALGVILLVLHHRFNPLRLLYGMTVNGAVWLTGAMMVLINDWRSSIWILFTIVFVYSVFVAANMKVNFVGRPK